MPFLDNDTKSFKTISIKPVHVRGPTLYFPSIITDFSDSWNPKWTTDNVYGRMDPISFYNGTSRELTLGFRVISDDEAEASRNMNNIQRLIRYQYPSYTSVSGQPVLKAPPYFKFKFMNIVGGGKTLEGYINSALQINPGFQAKDQAQYFSENYEKLYFSDVKILLRIQVLHEGMIGYRISKNKASFKGGKNYPYGLEIVGDLEYDHPEDAPDSGNPAPEPDSTPAKPTPEPTAQDKKQKEKNKELARKTQIMKEIFSKQGKSLAEGLASLPGAFEGALKNILGLGTPKT